MILHTSSSTTGTLLLNSGTITINFYDNVAKTKSKVSVTNQYVQTIDMNRIMINNMQEEDERFTYISSTGPVSIHFFLSENGFS